MSSCPICTDLERALESRNGEYTKARAASVYCRISSRFAAYSNVEMERAKSELDVHRAVCISALTAAWQPFSLPRSAEPITPSAQSAMR